MSALTPYLTSVFVIVGCGLFHITHARLKHNPSPLAFSLSLCFCFVDGVYCIILPPYSFCLVPVRLLQGDRLEDIMSNKDGSNDDMLSTPELKGSAMAKPIGKTDAATNKRGATDTSMSPKSKVRERGARIVDGVCVVLFCVALGVPFMLLCLLC